MGKGDTKKAEESSPPLNDENWNAFIFVIYLDAGTPDANSAKLSALGEWIASGYRQKFTTVTRSDIVAWATENAKSIDSCKDLKAALDGGASEITVSDSIMAKAVKSWLLLQKEEGLEEKKGKEAQQVDVDDKGKVKPPKDTVAATGTKKAPAGAAPNTKGGKPDVSPTASAGSDSKRKVKLRERTGGPQKDRITAIGDEPLDGPDRYYYFRDLDSASFVTAFNEEADVSVDVAFRGVYDPAEAVGKKGEKDKTEEQMANHVWAAIKKRAKSSLVETWRKTAWELMKNADFKDPKDAFELLSARIYKLFDKRKAYEAFFKNDRVFKIPSFDKERVDLRYYDYLTSIANSGGVSNIEFILALTLEFIGRISSTDEASEQNEFATGFLKQYLDAELSRVGLDTNVKLSESENEKVQNMTTIEFCDKTGLDAFFMKSLQSINLNPVEIIKKIQASYKSSRYVYFTEKISEFKTMKSSRILAESLKLLTEFLKSTSIKDMDVTRAEKQLVQIELERKCKQLLDPACNSFSIQEWKWFGALSTASIAQAIEHAKIARPEVYYQFAPTPGKLLLTLKSPGPIGCLEFHTSKSVNIRPKVGFSMFNDLHDPANNKIGTEKPSIAGSPPPTSYDVNDRMLAIHEDISYLYPANSIIINVTKKKRANQGRDTTTKVLFGDSALQICGTAQSQNGASYLSCHFGDDATFSISSKAGQLSIQFCDVNGRVYSFAKDGSVTSQSFAKSPVTTSIKSREIKRVYLPSGAVIKHFESKSTQVLFPDGSYATRAHGSKDWTKITKNDQDQKISVETKNQNDDVDIGREDFVSISKKGNSILVEHACLTSIETILSKGCVIKSPENATITFSSSGRQEVEMPGSFKVERMFEEGFTTSIKVKRSDMTIEMMPSGEILLKMSDTGYATPIPSNFNKMDINWMSGTLSLTDILGYEFLVAENGSTTIKKPAEQVAPPNYTFGGRLIKEALKSDSADSFIGNTPIFFSISPDGQDSYQLQRDSDLFRYYQSNHHQFSRIIEDKGASPGSITYCSTKKYKADLVESSLVQYSQFTRYQSVNKTEFALIAQEYDELLSRYQARNQVVPNEELGETPESLLEDTKNKFPFVFGMNKEATQLAILLKYLEKEELKVDAGLHLNTQMQQLLNHAKSLRKPVPATVSSTNTETPKASKKKAGPYKVPKYFESPEGKTFISASVVKSKLATTKASFLSNAESSVAKREETIKLIEMDKVIVPTESTTDRAVAAEASSVTNTESIAIIPPAAPQPIAAPTETEKPEKKIKDPKPKVKKERKLELPSAILGEKPGVIPNSSYIKREADVRRQINTVSTAQSRRQNSNYGSAGFVVRPSAVQFGNIDASVPEKPSFSFVMTNIGLDSGRFKIKQSPNSAVAVDYKHGPVAPGMAVTFTCTLKNHRELKPETTIEEEIKIVSEMEILHVPIKGIVVQPKARPATADYK